MGTPRMNISYDAYETINTLKNHLNCERPQAIEIVFAKGLSASDRQFSMTGKADNKKWEMPANLIKDDKYILYKSLIVEEIKEELVTEDDLKKYFIHFIEKGAAIVDLEINRLNELSDYRIEILNQDS